MKKHIVLPFRFIILGWAKHDGCIFISQLSADLANGVRLGHQPHFPSQSTGMEGRAFRLVECGSNLWFSLCCGSCSGRLSHNQVIRCSYEKPFIGLFWKRSGCHIKLLSYCLPRNKCRVNAGDMIYSQDALLYTHTASVKGPWRPFYLQQHWILKHPANVSRWEKHQKSFGIHSECGKNSSNSPGCCLSGNSTHSEPENWDGYFTL